MKFSYNWIKELVGGLDADARELSRLITMKTAESEGVEEIGSHFVGVRAGRILSVEKIAGSKNVKALVELGAGGKKTVVCGAPNCRVGMVSAYMPCGTKVIAGVESEGMLASGAELGINRDREGILELTVEAGEELGCAPDSIIEIDNKSLTHRPDLWGHYGMAREVSAISRKPLKDPVRMDRLPLEGNTVGVEIEDLELCPRYSALVFDNVKVGPSPLWMQYRLEAIGLNPINNIVDVTNFVMAELAQPMHAFDADKLHGSTIFVRSAAAGESIAALNDETYELSTANLVIADANGPIAIAGVIGGRDSAIGASTTRIVLESACFQAASVRKTSSALRLRTDASMRFEKSQDPVNTVRGLARAIDLLREVCPGIRLAGGLADRRGAFRSAPVIELSLEWLGRKLGRAVGAEEVKGILEGLQFGVEEPSGTHFSVTVPSWRATKDVSIKDDLVEEVGRMIGYDSITPQAPELPVRSPIINRKRAYQHRVREMTAAQGFDEVYNYSFLSEDLARKFGFEAAEHVAVTNPIAADQSLMRLSLIPGIWKNVQENGKHFDSFRLFEIGNEIHKSNDGLPAEVTHLVAAIYSKQDVADGLFELKRLAECLASGIETEPAAARAFEHPARTAELVLKGQRVGRLFEIHPSLMDQGRAAILYIDLDELEQLQPKDLRYHAVNRFPSSAFDLSVVVPERTLVGNVRKELAQLAGPQLEKIEFVRQYSGPPLAAGMKSVSYRLTVASPDHTLSSEEITAIRENIIQGMRSAGYELRV